MRINIIYYTVSVIIMMAIYTVVAVTFDSFVSPLLYTNTYNNDMVAKMLDQKYYDHWRVG